MSAATYAQEHSYFGNYIYHKPVEDITPPQKRQTFLSFQYSVFNYLGDLGGNSGVGKKYLGDNNFKKNNFAIGFSLLRMYHEKIGWRINFTSGNLSGTDADVLYVNKADNAYTRYKRNLDFRTKITEGSLQVELYPFKWINYTKKINRSSIQPYVLGGVGVFHFNPEGSYFDGIAQENVWVALQPLHTEGQGFPEYPDRKNYKLTQLNILYGGGISFQLGLKSKIAAEFIGRKLFTDYLDDVSTTFIDKNAFTRNLSAEDADIAKAIFNKSNLIEPGSVYGTNDQRGNPKNKDAYFSFGLKLSFQINQPKPPEKWYKFDNIEICE